MRVHQMKRGVWPDDPDVESTNIQHRRRLDKLADQRFDQRLRQPAVLSTGWPIIRLIG